MRRLQWYKRGAAYSRFGVIPHDIITYCLVAIVHHDMQLKRSTYEVLQILSISLTDS